MQFGRGAHAPTFAPHARHGLVCRSFRFTDAAGIAQEMAGAALIISHAGSGSIIESLSRQKPLLVVVNDALMDNHQAELAGQLDADGHLHCTGCQGLLAALQQRTPPFVLPSNTDRHGRLRAADAWAATRRGCRVVALRNGARVCRRFRCAAAHAAAQGSGVCARGRHVDGLVMNAFFFALCGAMNPRIALCSADGTRIRGVSWAGGLPSAMLVAANAAPWPPTGASETRHGWRGQRLGKEQRCLDPRRHCFLAILSGLRLVGIASARR